MKTCLSVWLILVLICSNSCEDFYAVTIENHSDQHIKFYVTMPWSHFQYPDTLLPAQEIHPIELLPSKSTHYYTGLPGPPWEEIFKRLPADTLSIYIFDADTLSAHPWNVIRSQYNILKRYDLSLQDLQSLDFVVMYPPDASMQGMKMFPK